MVVSSDGADVPDAQAAIPLVAALVDALGEATRVVAVEAVRPAAGDVKEARGTFLAPLRSSSKTVDSAVSTVNDLEDFRGVVAMVLALADLGQGRVGHYGVGSGADSLVPESGMTPVVALVPAYRRADRVGATVRPWRRWPTRCSWSTTAPTTTAPPKRLPAPPAPRSSCCR